MHQIEYINSQKPKNYFAYLKKAIQDDYANNEKANFQEEKEKLKEKYKPQIKRILDLNVEKVPLKHSDGDIDYLFYIVFEDDNLVVMTERKGTNTIYQKKIELKKDNEKRIAKILDNLESVIGKYKSKNSET